MYYYKSKKYLQLNFTKGYGVQKSEKWILLNDTLTDDWIIRVTSTDIRSSQNDDTYDATLKFNRKKYFEIFLSFYVNVLFWNSGK